MTFKWDGNEMVPGEKPKYDWKTDVWFYVGLLAVGGFAWCFIFSRMVGGAILQWFHI